MTDFANDHTAGDTYAPVDGLGPHEFVLGLIVLAAP